MANKPLISKTEMMLISDGISENVETAKVKVNVYVQKDIPKLKGEPYTMLFQKLGIVTARAIKPITAKLLLYLCAVVEYGNVIPKGNKEISDDLGYSIRNVQRALLELEKLRIIIRQKSPNDCRMNIIYLNPFQSWKGKTQERSKKIAELSKSNQLELFPISEQKKSQIIALKPNEDFIK